MNGVAGAQLGEEMSSSVKRTFATIGEDANSVPFAPQENDSSEEELRVSKRRKLDVEESPCIKRGRWDKYEHSLFVKGLQIYGRQWKLIAEMIKTRTAVQIRSHAQKYFNKLEKLQHQRLVGICTHNEAIRLHSQAANPYHSYAHLAQVQMMMQGGHVPHFYSQVGAPQLAAFKALYARNNGLTAAPPTTTAPQILQQQPTTTAPTSDPSFKQTDTSSATTVQKQTTASTPTLPTPTLPTPVHQQTPPPLMSPYQFATTNPYFPAMNHPLVLAAMQGQRFQQQQHLLKLQQQAAAATSSATMLPMMSNLSVPPGEQHQFFPGVASAVISAHQSLRQQQQAVEKDEREEKPSDDDVKSSDDIESKGDETQNLVLKKVIDSASRDSSPQTVDVSGTSSPKRGKRVEMMKPVDKDEPGLVDGEETISEEEEVSNVLASLASSSDNSSGDPI